MLLVTRLVPGEGIWCPCFTLGDTWKKWPLTEPPTSPQSPVQAALEGTGEAAGGPAQSTVFSLVLQPAGSCGHRRQLAPWGHAACSVLTGPREHVASTALDLGEAELRHHPEVQGVSTYSRPHWQPGPSGGLPSPDSKTLRLRSTQPPCSSCHEDTPEKLSCRLLMAFLMSQGRYAGNERIN